MKRFTIATAQLETVCAMALRQGIPAVDTVSVVPTYGDMTTGNWEVLAITPALGVVDEAWARDVLSEIHRAFALAVVQ